MNLSSESKSRRQLIIEAAAIHFNTNGYAATSIQDITQSVGIQAAILYNHISSKQKILSELLLTITNKFGNGIKGIYKSDLAYKEKLKEVIRQHITNYRLVVDRKGTMDTVKVEVETLPNVATSNDNISQELTRKIKNIVGLSMKVDLKSPNSIPRSQGGKLSRILDMRKK